MNTFLYFESRVRARTSPKIIFRPPVDAKKIERYAPHLRLNREWGFIFRSIKTHSFYGSAKLSLNVLNFVKLSRVRVVINESPKVRTNRLCFMVIRNSRTCSKTTVFERTCSIVF